MSIFPVPLQKWFPNPAYHKDQVGSVDYEILRIIVKTDRCYNCGKHCKYNRAWGHHALPFGYGDLWCSKECLRGPKKRKKRKREPIRRGRDKRNYKIMLEGFKEYEKELEKRGLKD